MTHREVLEALSGILLGMFVSILATSVVSSSLPRIISDLDGTQSAFTWVVTATLLTTTISTPIWGKLADLVDRKLLIQLALVISVVSSAARRALPRHRHAHRHARPAGHRRRRPHRARHGPHRRHHQPARARPVHGPHGRRHGHRHGRRPAARRRHHRQRRLALELLRRPAVRDRRDHRAPADAAPARTQGAQGEDRLRRRHAPVGRHRDPAAVDHVRGHLVRLGLVADRRHGRRLAAGPRAPRSGSSPARASRSSRCTCSRTARWSCPSSPASPWASRCSAPRCSSASTCSWRAARRRRSPAC